MQTVRGMPLYSHLLVSAFATFVSASTVNTGPAFYAAAPGGAWDAAGATAPLCGSGIDDGDTLESVRINRTLQKLTLRSSVRRVLNCGPWRVEGRVISLRPFLLTMNPSPAAVLLVEDNDDDVVLFRMSWRKAAADASLHHAEDGKQAIDYLKGARDFADRARHPLPFLVLLDLQLPLVHGFEVLSWSRAQPALNEVCIVILSSSPETRDVAKAYQLGANCYLTKPISPVTLRDLLSEVSNGRFTAGSCLSLRAAERAPRELN